MACDDDYSCVCIVQSADLSCGDGPCADNYDALFAKVKIYWIFGHGIVIIPVRRLGGQKINLKFIIAIGFEECGFWGSFLGLSGF